jgi:hypothetical protein
MSVAAQLAGLQPQDVRVEFLGRRTLPETPRENVALSSYRQALHEGLWRADLRPSGEAEPDGSLVYELDAPAVAYGQFHGEVRIYPVHPLLTHPHEIGLMKWMAP